MYNTHMKTAKKSRHIIIALRYSQPDNRARLYGALRFFASHADVETRVIDSSSPNFRHDCNRLTSSWPVDGIIFSYPEDIRDILEHCHGKRPSLAMLDGPRDFPKANVDVRMRTQDITDGVVDLLKRRGYRNFAFCGTCLPSEQAYSSEVEACFRKSLDQTPSVFLESPDESFSANLQRATFWARSLPKPCATMCYSDEIARNLLNACNMAHVAVPEQIAVIGLGNSAEVCETTRPALTSVSPDFEQSGYEAAKLVYQCIVDKRKRSSTQTYGLRKLVERESTTDLRGCGRLVSAATELMRNTTLKQLSAKVIAARLNVSRRILEMHFKQVIGHGVHAEISHMRLEAIREQLHTTSNPIGIIVEECGFKSYTAAQIAFRKRYNDTMSNYRNRP